MLLDLSQQRLDLSLILQKVVFLLFLMIRLRALLISKHGG